jgi:hypothetical protein
MPSHMTTSPVAGAAAEGCGGFAEPAHILPRLDPDDLHPARLAGPHAWHPWALTAPTPTDRHLRLQLPHTTPNGTLGQVLDRLQARLQATPFPPAPPLAVRRDGNALDCRDPDARRAFIELTIATPPRRPGREQQEIVTRDGWPILDELAALNDRISSIDPHDPARAELADLARWVQHKMTEPVGPAQPTTPLAGLLHRQAAEHPHQSERLHTTLAHRSRLPPRDQQLLDYLTEQLEHQRTRTARPATPVWRPPSRHP